MALLAFIAMVTCAIARADCFTDSKGNVVCGKGECDVDQRAKVWCAAAGGGVGRDQYGEVRCGTGKCIRDVSGKVWCSKEVGGGVAQDGYGVAKCLGGCEEGTKEKCQEAK